MINIEQGCIEQRDARVFLYECTSTKMTVQSIKCFGVATDSLSEKFRQPDY